MAYCVDNKNEVRCKTMHLSKHLIKYLLSFKLSADLNLITLTVLMARINVSLLLFVSNSFTFRMEQTRVNKSLDLAWIILGAFLNVFK